jgi:hypothetical protein
MPISATFPIRRPGQRRAEGRPRRLTSASVVRMASELVRAPAITHSGALRDPVVPASKNT